MDSNALSLVLVNVTDLLKRFSDLENRLIQDEWCRDELERKLMENKREIESLKQQLLERQYNMRLPQQESSNGRSEASISGYVVLDADATNSGEGGTVRNAQITDLVEGSLELLTQRSGGHSSSDDLANSEADSTGINFSQDLNDFRVVGRKQTSPNDGPPVMIQQQTIGRLSTRVVAMKGRKSTKIRGRGTGPLKVKILPYKCRKCNEAFVSSQHLKDHLKSFHSRGKNSLLTTILSTHPNKCLYCARDFKSLGALKVHQKIHTPVKSRLQQCNHPGCDKLLYPELLPLHQRKHAGLHKEL